jgi:hypothetical protein
MKVHGMKRLPLRGESIDRHASRISIGVEDLAVVLNIQLSANSKKKRANPKSKLKSKSV